MRRNLVEARVLGILDRVVRGQPTEDTFAELKREWPPEPARAARRLAGLANAARGEHVLWIVGVDEGARTVPGAPEHELANWLPAVERCFDEGAPNALLTIAVPYEGVTVTALLFATDAAPYVVKNPAGGQISLEVPWRHGTAVRTARRQDLLRILAPVAHLPEVELLFAELEVNDDHTGEHSTWKLRATLYVIPPLGKATVVPRHRCSGSFSGPYGLPDTAFSEFRLCLQQHGDPEQREDAEAVVERPGQVMLVTKTTVRGQGGQFGMPARVRIALAPAHAAGPVYLDFELQHSANLGRGRHKWSWVPPAADAAE